MKSKLKTLLLLLFLNVLCFSQTLTNSNLPIVVINTNGQTIPNEPKITADMGIIDNGIGQINNVNDPFNDYDGKIGIELRGSSSQSFPKKQYAVETRDLSGNPLNVPLLGMPEENDWILHAPYSDKSLMRNYLAYNLGTELGWYASRTRFCEVVINGDYKGVYILLEKVKRDDNRVDIKKILPNDNSGDELSGGYLIKIDKSTGANNDGWASTFPPYAGSSHQILYKYHNPDPTEITNAQKTYIQNFIFQFESMMDSVNYTNPFSGYYDLVNIDSFVDFFIMNEIGKNVDGYRISTYLYKDRNSVDSTLHIGPLWDFNLAFGNADYYDGELTNGWHYEFPFTGDGNQVPFWWDKFYADPFFQNKLALRWQELRSDILHTDSLWAYIDSTVSLLDSAQTRNFQRWQILDTYIWPNAYVGMTYPNEITYLKTWIQGRLIWMDLQISPTPSFIDWEKPENISINYPLGGAETFHLGELIKSPTTNIDSVTFIGNFPQLQIYQNFDSLTVTSFFAGDFLLKGLGWKNGEIVFHSPSYEVKAIASDLTTTNLPIVVINSGINQIPENNKITAQMGIISNGNPNNLYDPFNDFDGFIGIEILENESNLETFPKKDYYLETRDSNGNNLNVSLLGMPSENDWILYAPYSDKTLMRNHFAYTISNEIGNYAPRTKLCELVVNNDYKGIYVLMEKIKRDKDRVDIKKLDENDVSGNAVTGGYILQVNSNSNEDWFSNFPPFSGAIKQISYSYNYPSKNDIQPEQEIYIQNYIQQFETLIDSSAFDAVFGGYYDFVNFDSFVDFFILNEFAKNVKGFRQNFYLHKDRDDENGKLTAGPIWDFNIAFGNANFYDGAGATGWISDFNQPNEELQIPFWWKKMIQDPIFQNSVSKRWEILRTDELHKDSLSAKITGFETYLDQAQNRNFTKWQTLGELVWPNQFAFQTYQNEIVYFENWVESRIDWIDSNLPTPSKVTWENPESTVILAPLQQATTISKSTFYTSLTNVDSLSFFSENTSLTVSQNQDSVFFTTTQNGEFEIKGVGYRNGEKVEISPKFLVTTTLTEIESKNSKPEYFILSQNYPNPFNPTTVVNYELLITNYEKGKLLIFNILGEKVKEFELTKNKGSVIWNGTNSFGKQVSSGIYFYRIEVGDFRKTKKMLLLK